MKFLPNRRVAPAKLERVAFKNKESSLENGREVPLKAKSSTTFVKSPSVIAKSLTAIDKSTSMICLFQNIFVTLQSKH
jgi:hypothetical protein